MFGIDRWEWFHIVFGLGIVIANIGVARGVILEESDDKWTKETGARLLRRSLVAEAFLAFVLLGVDSYVSIEQQSKIIALERRLAARSLSDDQVKAIIERLKPFAGQHFDIVPYWQNPESYTIADRLYKALPAAGWVYDHPVKVRGMILGVVTGISVWSDKRSEPSMKSAAGLIAALNANGIEARPDDTPQTSTEPISTKINISVGIKP